MFKLFGKLMYKFLLHRDMSVSRSKNTGFAYNIWYDEITYQIHPFRKLIRLYIETDDKCWYPLIITDSKLYYIGKKNDKIDNIINALSNRYMIFKTYWLDWGNDILDGDSMRDALKLMNTNISSADIMRQIIIKQ